MAREVLKNAEIIKVVLREESDTTEQLLFHFFLLKSL